VWRDPLALGIAGETGVDCPGAENNPLTRLRLFYICSLAPS
jgi:hypothetical protein